MTAPSAGSAECAELIPTFIRMSTDTASKKPAASPLMVDLASICGCRFALRAWSMGTAILLASSDTQVSRHLSTDVVPGYAFLDWLVTVTEALEQTAAGDGDAIGSTWSAPDGSPLTAEATLLDGPGGVVRIRVTLEGDEHDSLDLCHVSVTLDLSLRDLAEQIAEAAASIPGGGE